MKKHIHIGKQERPVLFGLNTYVEIEKITGKMLSDLNLGSMVDLRALVYSGLKWGLYKNDGAEPAPKFSLAQVGEWMLNEEGVISEVVMQVLSVFTESLPKEKKTEDQENPSE